MKFVSKLGMILACVSLLAMVGCGRSTKVVKPSITSQEHKKDTEASSPQRSKIKKKKRRILPALIKFICADISLVGSFAFFVGNASHGLTAAAVALNNSLGLGAFICGLGLIGWGIRDIIGYDEIQSSPEAELKK